MHQKQNRITVRIFSVLFACAVLCCWLWPRAEFSAGERRKLAQLPTFTVQRFLNGKYASEFESFALDQFPLRESWRTLKALFSREIYRRPDNNGIYLEKGYAAQLEYPLNTDSIDHAAQRFGYLYQQYLEGTAGNVYLSIVPDKGYFLAEENGSFRITVGSACGGNFRETAAIVWFSLPIAAASAESACSGSKPLSAASSGITSLTCILPVVIVPVLSRQRTSTRARLSTQYKS